VDDEAAGFSGHQHRIFHEQLHVVRPLRNRHAGSFAIAVVAAGQRGGGAQQHEEKTCPEGFHR
jgi:hypothetical protein